MKNWSYLVLLIGLLAAASCTKTTVIEQPTPDLPFNPFDTLTFQENGEVDIPIDSNSFLGLHAHIFKPKCAVPACHDGAFEPDFRTVESSYNTLVFHEVLKNDAQQSFTYRVVPGDTANSWMHERITTDDPVLGRMPLYDTLSKAQIARIEQWIMEGAKNAFDIAPTYPNPQPTFHGIVAYENDINGRRLDTTRARIIDPMIFPENTQVDVWFGIYDDKDLPPFLGDNTFRLSKNPYDFSQATPEPLIVEFTPHNAPSPFGGIAPYFHHIKINTGQLQKNTMYFMQVQVKDSDHSFSTAIPDAGSPIYLFTFFSFMIQ